jgi:ABC-type glycerol-3-phosphate transport system substrate-binding protein
MKLRPFELALVVVFILLIAVSLVLLKTYRADKNDGLPVVGTITIWGTLPEAAFKSLLQDFSKVNEQYNRVSYRSIEPASFSNELVNALADGVGPDMILLSSEQLVETRKKIKPVSFESFPKRDIASLYVDGAAIFALSDGLYAYPLALDPLVMYWNKDLLATANLLEAPKTWESLVNQYTPILTKRASDRTIERSAVALGEYGNVQNSFGIISTLLLQSGSYTVTNPQEGEYLVALNTSQNPEIQPLRVTADFYTRFSRPDNTLYSWNRSFSSDKDRFVSGDLAIYFGYGSEGPELERLNPNLNFDIAEIPQGATATIRRTYAQFYGLAALKTSDNLPGVSLVLKDLSQQTVIDRFARDYHMVPALRSSVAVGSNDLYGRITYKSASVAYGWLNPNRPGTDAAFLTMTRDITENRADVSSAITDAIERLELEYNK